MRFSDFLLVSDPTDLNYIVGYTEEQNIRIDVADFFAGNISGSGTPGYVPVFTSAQVIGDSVIYQNGSNIVIGSEESLDYRLAVVGSLYVSNGAVIDTTISGDEGLRVIAEEGDIFVVPNDLGQSISSLRRIIHPPAILSTESATLGQLNAAISTLEGDIDILLDLKVDKSSVGEPNGVASLDATGKIPLSEIPDSIIGQVEYMGTWNAFTNTPTLNPLVPEEKGHYYVVSAAGVFGGIDYEVGDWIISNGVEWQKVDNTDAVTSVFGRIGAILALEGDYQAFYPRLSQAYDNPTWINSLAFTKITDVPPFLLENQTITLSGDVTGTGKTSITSTISNNVVSNEKLRDSLGTSVIGRAASSTGDPGDIQASTDGHVLQRSGGTLLFGLISSDSIGSIDWSKIINTPTTLSGYDITDAYTKTEADNKFVPYTGANANVNLGSNNITANSFIKAGGTSAQFLKADGSVDTSQYVPTTRSINAGTGLTGGGNLSSDINIAFDTTWGDTRYAYRTRQLTINGTTYDLSADRIWNVGTVTSVGLSAPTGFSVSNSPVTTSGTLALAFASGYSLPTNASQATWDTAYNNSIVSAEVTGIETKLLTLNQQDGGTITASWSDFDTAPVTSVFGRLGAIVAQSGDYTTTLVTEGINLYFTESRARLAVSLTTIGNSGFATYNSTTGVFNIPNYSTDLTGYVPYTGANQTVNLNTQQLQAGHTTLTTNGSTETLTINHTSGSGKAINVTKGGNGEGLYVNKTSGSGNAATIIGTLEATTLVKTGGTSSQFLKADGSVDSTAYGTVSSVAALTLGTSGIDLSSSVVNSTTTPVITLNVPTASAVNRGALSAADWTTFNSKQNAITLTTTGTTGPATLIGATLNIPNYTPDLSGYVTLGTDQTIAGLKTIVRSGDVLNFKIGTDTLYGLKVAYNQNELVPSGEATWSFVNTFNRNGVGYETTPISFFRGVLVTGERLLSASINANLLDYYGNNPAGRYPVYAYNTGVQQFASSIIVGEQSGVVNPVTGSIADLPLGVVANFHGRVIGQSAANSNEFVTLSQLNGSLSAYLPLTGGTLTGALNGTSASFTAAGGSVSISNASDIWYNLTRGSSITNIGIDATGTFYNTNTSHRFLTNSGTINALTLASTGAATFSGSVSAASFNLGNGQFLRLTRNSGALQYDALGIVAGTDNTRLISTGDFDIVNGSLTSYFKVASTGAATFSSSVTASSFVKAGGTSSQYLMADGSVTTGSGGFSGTTNTMAKFTSSTTIGNSLLTDNGSTLSYSGVFNFTSGKFYSVNNGNGQSYELYVDAGDGANAWRHIYGGTGTGYGAGVGGYGVYYEGNSSYNAIFNPSGFVTFEYSARSPIFYDSQNTGFYIDPSGSSVFNNSITTTSINGGLRVTSSGTATTQAAIAIQQVTGEGDTIIFADYEPYAEYGIIARNSLDSIDFTSGTTSNSIDSYNITNRSGSTRTAYVKTRINLASGVTTMGDARAPIYYDQNDTSYYVDPNSLSNLARVALYGNDNQLYINTITNGSAGIFFQENGANRWEAYHYQGRFRFYNYTTASEELSLDNAGGFVTARTSFRAPIFYDSNDTGYYIDPASTGLSLSSNGIVSSGAGGGFQNRVFVSGRNRIWSFGNADSYGISYFQNPDYIGLHFGSATQAGSLFWVSDSGISQTSESSRAPIFYDSNDTSFYVDPNGTSELLTITTGTRARWGEPRIWTNRQAYTSDVSYWTGTNGWATSEGNWDNAWKGGFSGWDIWGTGTAHPQGGGYVHAQGIVSGQHAAASDGSTGYGWMMVGAGDAISNRYWLRGKWGGTTSGWVEMITTGNIASQVAANVSANTNSITSAVGSSYTWTGIQNFQSNLGGYSGSLANPPLQAYSTANNSAFMSFHKGGNYAVNMGLDADNVMRIGGWSAAADRWVLDMSGNNWVAGSFRAPIFYDSGNTNYYVAPSGTSRVLNVQAEYIGVGQAINTGYRIIASGDYYANAGGNYWAEGRFKQYRGSGTWHDVIDTGNIGSQSVNALNTAYAGGVQSNPQVYFGNGVGLKAAMTGHWSVWSDTLWINGYSGGDVPQMCALHTLRNGQPRIAISAQSSLGTSYGTIYELWSSYNMDAPNKSGTSYYQTNTWMQFNGFYGLYWPSQYGAHFSPNDLTTYTQFTLRGNKNGYGGINDEYSKVQGIMYDGSGNGGVYRENNGRWYFYYHLGNDCMGIGTSSTSSAYSLYLNKGVYAQSRIDATIYYDSANTAYYLDPNGPSYLASSLEIANGYVLTNGVGGAIFMSSAAGGFGGYMRFAQHAVIENINAGYHVYVLDSNGTGVVKLYGAQSWSAQSDGRIKTVHSIIENNLSKLESINPIYYSFNNFADDKNRIGLIAQEVQEHFPELVGLDPKTGYLNLDYTGLIPILLGAIKELKNKVETLEKQL